MMDKTLIIGSEGFVGTYLKNQYKNEKNVFFSDIVDKNEKRYFKVDITNNEEIYNIFKKLKPSTIFFLAAQSSVKLSIENPQLTFKINVEGLLNVLETIKKLKYKPYFIYISTIEVYDTTKGKINERIPYNCKNPYAISKCTGEKLLKFYENIGVIDSIILQPVTHIGPGQGDIFSISSFAKQIALLEKNNQNKIFVGNLDIERDILDVRDVIKFYHKILTDKPTDFEKVIIASGKIYNYRDLLKKLIDLSTKKDIKIVVDKKRLRPVDVKTISVNISYALSKFLWKSEIPIEKTLNDMLNYWREHL